MTDKTLNLFFGQTPSDEFLNDIEVLKKAKEKDIFDIADKIIEWYPKRETKKHIEEWLKNFKDEEKETKKDIIGIVFLIFKEFSANKISEIELKDDFEKLELPIKYFEHFIKKLKLSKEFTNEILKQSRPFESIIKSVDWRIDEKIYNSGLQDKIAVVELNYISKGEKETAQFDLNLQALKHLISTLKKIEDKLC